MNKWKIAFGLLMFEPSFGSETLGAERSWQATKENCTEQVKFIPVDLKQFDQEKAERSSFSVAWKSKNRLYFFKRLLKNESIIPRPMITIARVTYSYNDDLKNSLFTKTEQMDFSVVGGKLAPSSKILSVISETDDDGSTVFWETEDGQKKGRLLGRRGPPSKTTGDGEGSATSVQSKTEDLVLTMNCSNAPLQSLQGLIPHQQEYFSRFNEFDTVMRKMIKNEALGKSGEMLLSDADKAWNLVIKSIEKSESSRISKNSAIRGSSQAKKNLSDEEKDELWRTNRARKKSTKPRDGSYGERPADRQEEIEYNKRQALRRFYCNQVWIPEHCDKPDIFK